MGAMTRDELQGFIRGIVDDALEPMKKERTEFMSSLVRGLPGNEPKEEKVDKGQMVGRFIRAMAAGRGDPDRAAAWAKKQWGDDYVAKALAAGDSTAGGFIVPDQYSADIIELLRAQAIVRRMGPVTIPMPTGTLRVPKLTGGATATYIGENSNIVKTEQTFGQLVLTWKKLAALVPISNDLLRFSSPSADAVVRDDLVASIALREDQAFIRDDGTSNTPKGLRYWAPAGNLVASSGTTLAQITSDLGDLVLALKDDNVRMIRPGWLMAPRSEQALMTIRDGNGNFAFRQEMLGGRLWGWPYAVTTQIPTNLGAGTESEVYLVDFADAVIGESTSLMIDSSSEAAYHDGSNVVAAFSLDQTVVRAIVQHDFGMRHDASVAVLTGVTWAP